MKSILAICCAVPAVAIPVLVVAGALPANLLWSVPLWALAGLVWVLAPSTGGPRCRCRLCTGELKVVRSLVDPSLSDPSATHSQRWGIVTNEGDQR